MQLEIFPSAPLLGTFQNRSLELGKKSRSRGRNRIKPVSKFRGKRRADFHSKDPAAGNPGRHDRQQSGPAALSKIGSASREGETTVEQGSTRHTMALPCPSRD